MKELSLAALKRLAKERGYKLLPQTTYDELKARARPEYVPTPAERRALARASREVREGKTVPLAVALRALER